MMTQAPTVRHQFRLFVVLWMAVSISDAILTGSQRSFLSGTWKGQVTTTLIGIKTESRRGGEFANSTMMEGEMDQRRNANVTECYQDCLDPQFVSKYRPACVIFTNEIDVYMKFDTKIDALGYHLAGHKKWINGETTWFPKLESTAKIISWEGGNLLMSSSYMPDITRCWNARAVAANPPNVTEHLTVAVKDTLNGLMLDAKTCPDKASMACYLEKDPAEFIITMVLYKQNPDESKKIDAQMGWDDGSVGTECTYTKVDPWDILLPADCWTKPPIEEMPLWIIIAVLGGLFTFCCGCCASCCMWCCKTFGDDIKIEELPWWLRCCCCCCSTCFKGLDNDAGSDDEFTGLKVEQKKTQKASYKPEWARKYGDHAEAWKAANKC